MPPRSENLPSSEEMPKRSNTVTIKFNKESSSSSPVVKMRMLSSTEVKSSPAVNKRTTSSSSSERETSSENSSSSEIKMRRVLRSPSASPYEVKTRRKSRGPFVGSNKETEQYEQKREIEKDIDKMAIFERKHKRGQSGLEHLNRDVLIRVMNYLSVGDRPNMSLSSPTVRHSVRQTPINLYSKVLEYKKVINLLKNNPDLIVTGLNVLMDDSTKNLEELRPYLANLHYLTV